MGAHRFCRSKNDFGKYWRKVTAFPGLGINVATPIFRVTLSGHYAFPFQMATAVCQYVGGDPFFNTLELTVGAVSVQHHLADDQQAPTASKNIQAKGNWTTRRMFFGFSFHVTNIGFSLASFFPNWNYLSKCKLIKAIF